MARKSRSATLVAVLLTFGLVAAACGDDDDTVGGTEPTTSSTDGGGPTSAGSDDVDADGVLRIVQNVTSAGTTFDPTTAASGVHQVFAALYGTLLVKTDLAEYEPYMATRVEIIDAETIEIDLREGMTFSDDTPVDAEALKFNLERTVATPNRKGLRSEILAAVEEVEVTGDLSATVHLSSPTSGIVYDLFAGPETVLISPTAIEGGLDLTKEAVGAGPFLLESWQPDVEMTLVKNPDHWNADEVLLAGLEFVQLTPGPPVVNGLRSNAVDVATAISFDAAPSLTDPILTETFEHPATFIVNVCKREPPLSDIRVRQAMAYAIDRDVLGQRLYGGDTEPVWSLQRAGQPYHEPELDDIYAYDPDRARELLAEAGYPDGFSTSMIVTPGNSTSAGEVIQAQWAAVGIDVELRPTSNVVQDFYIDGQAPMFPINQTRAGLDAFTVLLLPGAFANVCQYRNADIEAALAEAMAAPPNSDEAVETWSQLATLIQEELPFIPTVFHSQVAAYNDDRVGGLEWQLDEYGNRVSRLDGVFIKA